MEERWPERPCFDKADRPGLLSASGVKRSVGCLSWGRGSGRWRNMVMPYG